MRPISGVYVPFQLVCPISGGCVSFRAGVSQFRRVCIISGGYVSYWTGVSHFRRVSLDFDRFIRLWAVFRFQTVWRRECGWNFKINFQTFLRQNELKV